MKPAGVPIPLLAATGVQLAGRARAVGHGLPKGGKPAHRLRGNAAPVQGGKPARVSGGRG